MKTFINIDNDQTILSSTGRSADSLLSVFDRIEQQARIAYATKSASRSAMAAAAKGYLNIEDCLADVDCSSGACELTWKPNRQAVNC